MTMSRLPPILRPFSSSVIRPAAASRGTVSPTGIRMLPAAAARAASVRICVAGVQKKILWRRASAAWRNLAGLALQLLRDRADAGDEAATMQLAVLLTNRGDLDQAEQLLRDRADADDMAAALQLADLLTERGDLDQLRARADTGDWGAARRLADLLAERGDLDRLRARADAGDREADRSLADLLAERGDLDRLRARADAGDGGAARRLADLLAERGDLDQLRARADAGDGHADLLAGLLARRGQGEEAERLRRFGLNPDGSIACA
jgi:hypothetical protein